MLFFVGRIKIDCNMSVLFPLFEAHKTCSHISINHVHIIRLEVDSYSALQTCFSMCICEFACI